MDDLLLLRVRATLQRFRMLSRGETMVVGASGGPDSTALVHVLASLAGELGIRVHVAYFDHGLRQDASEDASLVAELSSTLGLPYHVGHGDTRAHANAERCSLEDAARRLRYTFLVGVARAQGAEAVATGHTLDDQAETVLMRLLRGSGLRGLAGIPPVRRHDGVRLIRPLLETPRMEVMAYLERHGLRWREDPTNRDLTFLRNRVRTVLLPVLEGYNPHVRQALARLATLLREDADALDELAAARIGEVLRREGDAIRIAREDLERFPVAVQRRALREAIRWLRGNDRGVGFVHLEGARRLAVEGLPGQRAELPGGLWVVRTADAVEVTVRADVSPVEAPRYRLEVPGSVAAPEFGVYLVAREVSWEEPGVQDLAARPSPHAIVVDPVRLGTVVTVRSPQPGDRFRPVGMGGHAKLVADFLREAGVPRHRRRWVPLLVTDQGEVVWVVGFRAAEVARPPRGQTALVKIEAQAMRADAVEERDGGGGEVSGRYHGGML